MLVATGVLDAAAGIPHQDVQSVVSGRQPRARAARSARAQRSTVVLPMAELSDDRPCAGVSRIRRISTVGAHDHDAQDVTGDGWTGLFNRG